MNEPINRRRFLQGSASLSLTSLFSPPKVLRAFGASLLGETEATPSPSMTLGRPLMAANLDHSLAVRCLAKPVSADRSVDDMETDLGWIASPVVKLSYTTERVRSGTRSLRFSTLMRNDEFIRATRSKEGHFTGDEAAFVGQPFSAFAMLNFKQPQDWSAFNRISLWCYLHPTITPTTSVSLQFLCAGATAGPWDPVSIHFINDLRPGEWNHLTWEISEYQRDRIVQFILMKPASGLPLATANPSITMDFDQLRLERVEVEPVSAWGVTHGKVAYSHFGYRPGAGKLAYCSEPEAQTFHILDAATNAAAAELPVRHLRNARGNYAVLDFTSVTKEGRYRLQCGNSKSEVFPIAEDAWSLLIDTTLNAFHGFRCGCAVPDAHDACHLDTFVEYKGDRRCMAGGWHDAANNTQFADSTHMSIYALLQLYERLQVDVSQRNRAQLVLDEAKWGLDWSLRTRFAPGIRLGKNYTSYWTDSKIGTDDDVVQTDAINDLRENIYSLVALSTAAHVLKSADPRLAAKSLKAAEEDYANIHPHVGTPIEPITYGDSGRGSWRDLTAFLAVSMSELFRATGKDSYRLESIRYGRWLLDLQEQSFVSGSPVTGYFYADAGRTQIQREVWGGSDDSGMLALRSLCDTFPDEPEWINWYAGLLIYSEYYCREGANASAPFNLIPTTVWRRKDIDTDLRPDRIGGAMASHASPMFPTPPTDELTQRQRLKMYEAGTPLSPEMRLRIFPIWYNHVQHGCTTGHLNRTSGLNCAAHVRGNLDAAELAGRQVEWIVGANPFSRSLLFGVGYDYWQNFTVDNVNFVGGMGLGMNSYEADAPAWPNNAVFPYKEQWSYSASRLALNLAQCATPAFLVGKATIPVKLRELRSGAIVSLLPGVIKRALPAGKYVASAGGVDWPLDLVGGGTYTINFDPQHAVTLSLESSVMEDHVTVHATLHGAGTHDIAVKLFNLTGETRVQRVSLRAGTAQSLSWQFKVVEKSKPWIAVVVPVSEPDLRQEVFGRVGAYPKLA